MFKKDNFCHIASNNRNEQKAGVFVYKTTDDLATVSVSGYFNEKIIDINLHDLIIHEWHDATDKTKVQRNVLCVIERTLDNVGTVVIKSKWEGDIEQTIEDLRTYVDNTFVRKDGTSIMSAPLKFIAGSFRGAVGPYLNGVEFYNVGSDGALGSAIARLTSTNGLTPNTDNVLDIGSATKRFKDLYIARVITGVINNGYDIAVPATAQPETLALKSEVDLAANSGRMITDEGVWFAKMYAASTVPTGAEYDGKNYADFSQVDSDNNPVIKIYTGASGAWTLTETITPPADYDGYVPITSKIWDILDQTGQQGGRVLWNHQTKTFTPYPQIISFDNQQITNSSFSGGTITSSTFDGEATLSGVSTAPTPTASSPNDQIANKQYVAQIAVPAGILAPFAGSSAPAGWLICDGSAKSRTEYADLFAAIGTTYGAGDGSTTFNLPDYSGAKMIKGTSVPVVGNGTAFNIRKHNGADATIQSGGGGSSPWNLQTTSSNIGANATNLEFSTNSAKSGLIANVSNYQDMLWCIKY